MELTRKKELVRKMEKEHPRRQKKMRGDWCLGSPRRREFKNEDMVSAEKRINKIRTRVSF